MVGVPRNKGCQNCVSKRFKVRVFFLLVSVCVGFVGFFEFCMETARFCINLMGIRCVCGLSAVSYSIVIDAICFL